MEPGNDPARIGDSSHLSLSLSGLFESHGEGEVEDLASLLAPYGVGIDCHSRFIAVCAYVADPPRYHRAESEFPTNWAGLKAAKNWALQVLVDHGQDVPAAELRYTLESTGVYHLPVCLAWEGVPSVVNPTLAAPSRRKTDRLDARLLAYHALTGLWPRTFLAGTDLQALRLLVAERQRQVKLATAALNRLNNTILRYGHTIAATGSLAKASIRPIVEDLAGGRLNTLPLGISPIPLSPAAASLVTDCYAEYDAARARARGLVKQSAAVVALWEIETESGPVSGKRLLELLCTVPGVGEVTALVWLAETGDWRRFPNPKAVAAYAGCDPSLKVSAGHVTSHTRRRGNENLHHALIQAAQYIVRAANEPLGQWGRRLWKTKGKGGWQRAVGATARRIAVGLYWVHRKGEPFSYAGYSLSNRRIGAVMPVEEMGLTVRVTKLLRHFGCATATDAEEAWLNGFEGMTGFGPKAREEVSKWMQVRKTMEAQREGRSSLPVSSSAE